MPFEKGRKKTGGKQKGAKDKKTIAWENIGSYLINEGANRAKEIMMNSNDRQFMFYFETLLEYFKPKLARTELTGDKENPIEIYNLHLTDDQLNERLSKFIKLGEKK